GRSLEAVVTTGRAESVEKILHYLCRDLSATAMRIERGEVWDGYTEWFAAEAFAQARAFIDGHAAMLGVTELRPVESRSRRTRIPSEVVLKKMGNSTAIVMPPGVLKHLGIGVGQHMTLETTADGKIVLSPKRKYVLADLIRQCDLNAPPPADLRLWGAAEAVGQEVL
uniref:AbrB/MazE/SpoVT family DNA-binding domain-containing protein n=1 Tax=Ideonella sp. B508-1 TaxID=137716 RepID=UPI001F21FCA4